MQTPSVQTAILLAALCHSAVSIAERRVGIVNCVPGTAGTRAIGQLHAVVSDRPGWSLLSAGLRRALEAPVADPVARARKEQARASRALTRFEHDRVLEALLAAEALLGSGPPTRELTTVLAELHVTAGVSYSLSGDRDSALASFRLASQLDPGRPALDPGRYQPSVVLLYAEAVARPPGDGSLELTAPAGARLWLDGVELGRSETRPASVPAGIHYLQASLPGHAPAWRKISIKVGDQTTVRLELRPLSATEQLAELREDLCAGREKEKVAALASLTGVHAVVLLRQAGATVFSAGGSPLGSPFAPDRRGDLYAALAQLDATAPPPARPRPGPGPPPPRRWYQTWWGRGAIIGAVAAVVAATVVVSYAVTREEEPYSIGGYCWRGACP